MRALDSISLSLRKRRRKEVRRLQIFFPPGSVTGINNVLVAFRHGPSMSTPASRSLSIRERRNKKSNTAKQAIAPRTLDGHACNLTPHSLSTVTPRKEGRIPTQANLAVKIIFNWFLIA